MVCFSTSLFHNNICSVKAWDGIWKSNFTFRDQTPKVLIKWGHTRRLTLAAVFLITVVHAVQHIIAAPASRDTVSTVQTKKLILSALLHTANLSAKIHCKSSKKGSSSDVVSCNQGKRNHWMIPVLKWVDPCLDKHLLIFQVWYSVKLHNLKNKHFIVASLSCLKLHWPHLSHPDSYHVHHTAGWLTHTLHWHTHTRSRNMKGLLEKGKVYQSVTIPLFSPRNHSGETFSVSFSMNKWKSCTSR